MKKIVLLTEDDSLRKELLDILPGDFQIAYRSYDSGKNFIFIDIDGTRAGVIKEYSERDFVIGITRQENTAPVMEAVSFGAYETLHRPLQKEIVLRMLSELDALKDELKNTIPLPKLPPAATCAIVGQSPEIMDVCKKLARLAQVETPVLITGETGTGKELIAEAIAQLSSRFGKPFVVINCAAVPEPLIESELFGFEKGSFTGAIASKEGMLRIADEGCLFLDEIGELPLALQGKLLRFLQTQTFYPIGSTKEVQVNVRVLSATNRDLSSMVKEGKFREDLYHRLSVTEIHVPPLRQRNRDILPLVHFFVDRYRHTAPRAIKGITKAFLDRLLSHDWPGNIRELENTVRSAIALSKTDHLTTHELKDIGVRPSASKTAPLSDTLASVLIPFVKEALDRKEKNIYDKVHEEVDRTLFEYILSHTRENQSEAARILGINRLTLRKKLRY